MPIPSYHEMLPAPSPLGSLPTSLEVPKDNAPAQAADIRRVASAVLGVGAFIEAGTSGKLIIGNGTPPSGGYTPTTRAIKILGAFGLEVETLNQTGAATKSGSAAVTVERRQSIPPSSVTYSMSHDKDFYYIQSPTPAGNVADITVLDPTIDDVVLEFAVWNIGINTVNIKRETIADIVQFAGGDWGGCRLRSVAGIWRLVSASGGFTVTQP